mmetsp:Transcript_41835/g.65367  ORF Transcript_41835/g.65367 Transcript_41835/m.65367 type:complete len:168 (+) Transcript_41835:448-951(+)
MALKLVHFVCYVSMEQYDNHELLDVILSERGRNGANGKSKSLLRLMCQEVDQEVFQILANDASAGLQEQVIMAFGNWLQGAESQLTVSANIMGLLLDTLAKVEDESCTGHLLLGFTPHQPSSTNLATLGCRRDCTTPSSLSTSAVGEFSPPRILLGDLLPTVPACWH